MAKTQQYQKQSRSAKRRKWLAICCLFIVVLLFLSIAVVLIVDK